jgi:hypothetical protein
LATLSSPTLGKLITNVRNLLGQPNPNNSFVTDAELTEYLNEGARMYFAEVVKNSEGYFNASPMTLDIVADTEEVALPVDCFEVRGLYITRSNGWEILDYRNNITSGFFTTAGVSSSQVYRPSYYFRGNDLVLHPTPNFSQTAALRLEYVAFPDQMVHGGDSLTNQVSPVFKQLLEMYAVCKAKMKQSMVNGVDLTSLPQKNLDAIYNVFKNTINKRSQNPEYIMPFSPDYFT